MMGKSVNLFSNFNTKNTYLVYRVCTDTIYCIQVPWQNKKVSEIKTLFDKVRLILLIVLK